MDVDNFFKILFELVSEQEQVKIEYQVIKNDKKVSNS